MLVRMSECCATFPGVPILRVVCVPMNVLEAVIMFVHVCMFELQVLLVVGADFLPSAKGDPNAECAQRDCGRGRNVMAVFHRERRAHDPDQRTEQKRRRHMTEPGDRRGSRGARDGPSLLSSENDDGGPVVGYEGVQDAYHGNRYDEKDAGMTDHQVTNAENRAPAPLTAV